MELTLGRFVLSSHTVPGQPPAAYRTGQRVHPAAQGDRDFRPHHAGLALSAGLHR
jgi:hypothetical protein